MKKYRIVLLSDVREIKYLEMIAEKLEIVENLIFFTKDRNNIACFNINNIAGWYVCEGEADV